jgi:hypothetical protein
MHFPPDWKEKLNFISDSRHDKVANSGGKCVFFLIPETIRSGLIIKEKDQNSKFEIRNSKFEKRKAKTLRTD